MTPIEEADATNGRALELVDTSDVMPRVWRGLKTAGLTDQQVIDAVHHMQAEGVFFREVK